MRCTTTTLPSLEENLALDEALLLEAEANPEQAVLRLWEWPRPGVVLGAAGKAGDDIHQDACRRDGVAMARRSSGGGTVLLGPGCLLFSLVLPYRYHPALTEIATSYRYILGTIRKALSRFAPNLVERGISDLAIGDRKCSGNSQQRKRHHILHHGTVLYDFPLAKITTYLNHPIRQPQYRQQRDHDSFVTNFPATGLQIRGTLQDAWTAAEEADRLPMETVARLVREKYSQTEWVFRR
jgi:lipoate-protein ligase A